jgi:hypothetical protein
MHFNRNGMFKPPFIRGLVSINIMGHFEVSFEES